jgi:hypothetical protein
MGVLRLLITQRPWFTASIFSISEFPVTVVSPPIDRSASNHISRRAGVDQVRADHQSQGRPSTRPRVAAGAPRAGRRGNRINTPDPLLAIATRRLAIGNHEVAAQYLAFFVSISLDPRYGRIIRRPLLEMSDSAAYCPCALARVPEGYPFWGVHRWHGLTRTTGACWNLRRSRGRMK